MRYLQLIYVDNNTGSPTEIFYKDRFIQLTILLWIMSFYVIIYYPNVFK
jgi:decaprenyl-phosphate phosphoribosyltransferase